jgi:pyridoxamine 5'-phosphate oxidase
MSSDFANIRAKYGDPKEVFDVKDLASKDPVAQFNDWFQLARKNAGIKEPNAMCIATSTLSGKPSNRMVLLKDFSDKGFSFFTNYSSKKGQELDANPQASICFYWDVMSRQIRIDGRVAKISREESIEYFGKRPLKSRVSALISDQSKVIKNKDVLIEMQKEAMEKYEPGNDCPTPDNWGGYLLIPEEFEFWQGNDIRLHDRLRFRKPQENEKLNEEMYTPGENGWIIERLAP